MKAPNPTLNRAAIAVMLAASAFAAGAAQAMARPFSPLDAGMLVDAPSDRSVVIGAQTRAVNVTNGETVTFTVGDRRFTYAFDAWSTIGAIDLAAIAPKGVTVPPVRVYIAPNPLSQG